MKIVTYGRSDNQERINGGKAEKITEEDKLEID
jgi:hypothetical protein